MAFLGLSLVTWQTLLIIGFPFICGSLSRIRAILLFIRHPFRKTPPSERNAASGAKKTAQVLPPRRYLRPQSFFLGFLLLGHLARFLSTNPSQSNPFRLTNQPLNVPSTTLLSSLERYYRSKGLKETPYEQERLIRKLNTLDARLLYSTIGPDPFLHCTWCRPPSSKANGADHLYFGLSRLGLQYASLLLAIGLMTTGASQLRMKRRIWRTRLALLSIFYFIFEAAVLSILVFIPSLLTAMDAGRMTWDALFLFRSLFFPFILFCSWWAVVSEPPSELLSPIAKVGLGLASVASDLDGLVNRLRLTALQRTALMKDGEYRSQIHSFWENVERQATLASSNPSIKSMKETMGLSTSDTMNHQSRDQLRTWIDNVFPDPSFDSSSPTSL
ncbi:hypothetical protein PGTUg99_003997 [Puccinia graminis f. sp. tritici]|uniref:Uncharacterized protein n=1 Tax=Puccinia graminis f. sp. tritici TaxID=56615 RepID=A0A5B0LUE9_PUCGR|nr:hypothetical protein PGTUg99_003997 [Puccinia graminis f. sp. tritici]